MPESDVPHDSVDLFSATRHSSSEISSENPILPVTWNLCLRVASRKNARVLNVTQAEFSRFSFCAKSSRTELIFHSLNDESDKSESSAFRFCFFVSKLRRPVSGSRSCGQQRNAVKPEQETSCWIAYADDDGKRAYKKKLLTVDWKEDRSLNIKCLRGFVELNSRICYTAEHSKLNINKLNEL